MSVWFSSDLHADHDNIIEICNRPFKNVNEMVRTYIENHNSVVKPKDEFFFVGDLMIGKNFSLGQKILKNLNGRKHIILGNHDDFRAHTYVSMGFDSAHTSYRFLENVYLNHDPATATIDKEAIWICGHIHDLFKTCGNVYNVGVDVNNFTPVPFDEILRYSQKRKNKTTEIENSWVKDI